MTDLVGEGMKTTMTDCPYCDDLMDISVVIEKKFVFTGSQIFILYDLSFHIHLCIYKQTEDWGVLCMKGYQ